MAQVSLLPVNLVTVCIVSALYGIFCVLSVVSIYLLCHNPCFLRKARLIPIPLSPMLPAGILLSLSVTVHWIIIIIRLFQAFIYHQGGLDAYGFYSDIPQTTEVAKTANIITSLVIGDSVIIYRLWIVWDHRYTVIVFPVCTLMGFTVCGVGITHQISRSIPGENVFVSQASQWVTSLCVLTLGTNMYSTVMITWKVWATNRAVRQFGAKNLMPLLATFVESAALYTTWAVFFFIVYQARSNLQYVAVDASPLISGLSFMLINVRVGMGCAQKACA